MTVIAHVSIPADDPKKAAEVLAEIMSGEAVRFPPGGPDSWMAWAGDGEVEIEITRRGLTIARGEHEAEWRSDGGERRLSDVHIALCVQRPAAEVIEIAKRAGWPARPCVRGGDIFGLTEVWVEGAFMVEVLDPAQTARYRERITLPNWKRFIAERQAAS